MSRPPKAIENVAGHRTKAEKKQRAEAEKELLTGKPLRERDGTAKNPAAHKEFLRVNELLTIIGKNDAIFEAVINLYCVLQAESVDFEEKRERFNENLDRLMESDELEDSEKFKLASQMQKTVIDLDKQIQTKRKMTLDIEKENGFTIASALRSIPKKVDKDNKLLARALADDG